MLVLILAFGAAARAAAPGEVPVSDYIRLHVLAGDDSRQAQALKLEVRDAVLGCARALLADCGGADEAWRLLGEELEALGEAARARARELGYEGPVAVQRGVFDFPDRQYGTVFVPAGAYRALRVVIGAGEGRNWWCVLYPSLCLTGDVEPGEPVRFYSAVWNWLRGLFGGDPE